MDAGSLLLQNAPYCVYKRIISLLETSIKDESEIIQTWTTKQWEGPVSATELYEELASKNWSCADLQVKVDALSHHALSQQCLKCISGQQSISMEQSLLSLNIALQEKEHAIEELKFSLRLLSQQEEINGRPEQVMVPFPAGSFRYRSPSPVLTIVDNPDEVEFG